MRCYVANRNTFVIPGLVRRKVAMVVSAKHLGGVEDGACVQLLVVCVIPCQALGLRRTSQHPVTAHPFDIMLSMSIVWSRCEGDGVDAKFAHMTQDVQHFTSASTLKWKCQSICESAVWYVGRPMPNRSVLSFTLRCKLLVLSNVVPIANDKLSRCTVWEFSH